jgi:hypothetical protein
MQENKLSILINAPAACVYQYTVNPANTPSWISSILKEETDEWPIKIGTTYRNTNNGETWDEYILTNLSENKKFQLKSKTSSYGVEYYYDEVSPTSSMLTYFEYDDVLSNPLKQEVLEKLKSLIETEYSRIVE